MAASAPTGAVTLVFTDVQGSTTLWETHTDAMRSALQTHNDVMRQLLVQHGGYEVKTEGDAFMLAFSSPQAAVAFCLHAQNALLDARWPEALATVDDASTEVDAAGKPIWRGLRVRMGVHVGAPEHEVNAITGRMDYFGPMVNRAARVASAAHGGQIVVSDEVHAALDMTALHEPVEHDLGEHWLKGLKSVEHLFSLVPQRLRGRHFEPVKSLPTPASGQPAFDSSPDDQFFKMLSERTTLDASGTLHRQAAPAQPPIPRPRPPAELPALELDESKLRVNREKAAEAAANAETPSGSKKTMLALIVAVVAVIGVSVFAMSSGIIPGATVSTKEVVHFLSEPPGATVIIDGKERGTTPLDLPNDFADGIYEAKLQKLGYEPMTVIFQGARTSTIKGDLRLKK